MDQPLFDESKSYRPDEVAYKLSVHKATVYRLIDDGKIPAFKLKNLLRIKGSELNKYVEANQVENY